MDTWLQQRTWRIIGGVSILAAAGMAYYGSTHVTIAAPRLFFAAYWLGFLLLFAVAIYMVLLDLRYIRLQFLLEERELFVKTMADEEIRQAIEKAQGRPVGGDDTKG